MTAAAVGYTMVEQFLPAVLKAVAITLLAGAAVVAAYLAWTAMRNDRQGGRR